jgi:hypothetical protein
MAMAQDDGGPPEDRDETLPAPWEEDAYLGGDEGARQRHNAFTRAKRRTFLKALTKTGCVLDACGAAGVSSTTVYDLQAKDAEFLKHCTLAIDIASVPVELTAWERGVTGVEEDVIRGGQVIGTRRKRSDSILRLLLQASNPAKYGPHPGFSRKQLTKLERDRIAQQVRADFAAKRPSFDDAMRMLQERLEKAGEGWDREMIEAGWVKTREGKLVPPGWTWAGDNGDEEHDLHGPAAGP